MAHNKYFRWALLYLALIGIFLISAWGKQSDTNALAAPPIQYLVNTTVLHPHCTSLPAYTTTYTKVADIGSFNIGSPDSVVEITYNGRFLVETFDPGNTGVTFELRVDDTASTEGRARVLVRSTEASLFVFGSMTGIFKGLPTGAHTVSVWAAGYFGGGSGVVIEPGCFDADHVVIEEFAVIRR